MKTRELKEFSRDMAYMKDDIWEDGEILKTFGHDPATYPNQDNPQHYPTVQFAGNPETNNKNHVLQDAEAKRTAINEALRAPKANAEGVFARDGEYMREALWDKVPVEAEGVERTVHGKMEDGLEIASRLGGREYGNPAKYEFAHQTGYMQTDILTKEESTDEPKVEPEEPEEPKVDPKPEPECPPETPDCPEGTLGNVLAVAEKAAEKIDQIIAPVGDQKDEVI